jgi:hypothetical protein
VHQEANPGTKNRSAVVETPCGAARALQMVLLRESGITQPAIAEATILFCNEWYSKNPALSSLVIRVQNLFNRGAAIN